MNWTFERLNFPEFIPTMVFTVQGVNSIDINYGPKMGPKMGSKMGPKSQMENWQIGRPGQAFPHWLNSDRRRKKVQVGNSESK